MSSAIARTVLFRRVRSVLIRAHGDGLIAHTLNFDYEVRSADEAFSELPDAKADDEMLDLALHIIKKKAGRFDPTKFDDRYDAALVELVKAKMEGRKITPPKAPEPTKPSDLMEALRQSADGDSEARAEKRKAAPRKDGQLENDQASQSRLGGLRFPGARRRGDARSLRAWSQRANESRSSVLITRSAGMPLFRAIAKPQRVEEAISPVEWASGLMLNLQPSSITAAQPAPVEIEPPGVAVDLDRDIMLGASGQHALDVQVVPRAAQQLATGHVTDHGNEWVGGCAHEAFGLRLAGRGGTARGCCR